MVSKGENPMNTCLFTESQYKEFLETFSHAQRILTKLTKKVEYKNETFYQIDIDQVLYQQRTALGVAFEEMKNHSTIEFDWQDIDNSLEDNGKKLKNLKSQCSKMKTEIKYLTEKAGTLKYDYKRKFGDWTQLEIPLRNGIREKIREYNSRRKKRKQIRFCLFGWWMGFIALRPFRFVVDLFVWAAKGIFFILKLLFSGVKKLFTPISKFISL
jgi:hypothetical protein